jgi:hypothetical protein
VVRGVCGLGFETMEELCFVARLIACCFRYLQTLVERLFRVSGFGFRVKLSLRHHVGHSKGVGFRNSKGVGYGADVGRGLCSMLLSFGFLASGFGLRVGGGGLH